MNKKILQKTLTNHALHGIIKYHKGRRHPHPQKFGDHSGKGLTKNKCSATISIPTIIL